MKEEAIATTASAGRVDSAGAVQAAGVASNDEKNTEIFESKKQIEETLKE